MLHLLLAIVSSALVSVTMRLSETKIKNNTAMLAVNYIMCAFLAWAYTGFDSWFLAGTGRQPTVIMGWINGILYLAGFVLLQRNIRVNGVVLSATFIKLGLLVSMVVSVAFFGERPQVWQWGGFFLAVAAIVLMNYRPGEGEAGNKAGLLLLLLAGGGGDAMSKVFEELGNPAHSGHFLLYTFLVAFVLCTALSAVRKQRSGKWEWLFGVLIGVPNFYSCRFLLLSLSAVPGVIAYPVYAVAGILLVTLAGVALFQEKLTRRQWIALAIILGALILLNI